MNRTTILAVLLAAAVGAQTHAQVTFELIDVPYLGYVGSSVSADGSVIVGNQYGSYETFRWTEQTGAVLLGRGTVAVLGVGAGIPCVSNDGNHISATILSDDGTKAVPGIWVNGVWSECLPLPAGNASLDNSLGSCWAISGDGTTTVGLYWQPGQPGGVAQPFAWSAAGGGVRLGNVGPNVHSSRVNGTNYDGSVSAGWREKPDGTWQPTVWENGVETLLDPTLGFCEAFNVNHDGTVVVGQTWNNGYQRRDACFWTKTPGGWVQTIIGSLPNTGPASVAALSCSADGSIIVGYNPFMDGPFSPATGFIWQQSTGMVDVETFLADNGIVVDPFFDISSLTDITPDGRVMIGYGFWTDTLDIQTFRITLPPPPACPGDADANNTVNFDDITTTLANWGALSDPYTDGDSNGDCIVNFDDITETLANWGASCS